MPVAPTYPGVYIEEVPSGVRTITGVATSIGAFLGYFNRGPMNEAVRILNPGDFEREFGGLRADSEASYAIDQFFLNGGTQAWVVRTAAGAPVASDVDLVDEGGAAVLTVRAANEGVWGDGLRIEVAPVANDPGALFNLTVLEVDGDTVLRTEAFRNLTMDEGVSNDVVEVVNGGSALVRLTRLGADPPVATGTSSPALVTADAGPGEIALGDAPFAGLAGTNLTVDYGGVTTATANLGAAPTSVKGLATALQGLIRAADPAYREISVLAHGELATGAYLQVTATAGDPGAEITLSGALAATLGLDDAGRTGAQRQVLDSGADGDLPDATALTGALSALETVDLFNILCIPDTVRLVDAEASQVAADATAFCAERRAFYILDIPQPAANPRDQVPEIEDWLDANSTLRHRNVATYFPRPRVADPLNDFRLRSIAASGTLAGVYARTDVERGVWKAPAGTEAGLRGVQALETVLTDAQNGILNPLGVNALRNFPVHGNVAWGGRTLDGADQRASEWKYIPVRRLALFLEESLFRGTQWVVFEPNDEPLWAQIRLNVGGFMQNLFRQGAFQGQTPEAAYLVKCDAETTTQNDIDSGVVNILVGFAPLKPAEFVIIRIQQLAGQIQT